MSALEKRESNRLLVVNQASRMLALELVAELGRSGWDCTIVTGAVPRDLTPPKNARLVIGASLRRTGMFARIGSSGCFTAQALWHIARNPRVPVLVVTNPPVLPLFLPLLRVLLGVQYSLLVYDVYPDVVEQMGILKPCGLIGRSWRHASRRTMRSAQTVITIGDCMARTLRGHLQPEDPLNITVIPTWVDAELIRPMNKAENPLVRRHGLEGRFVVMYSGNFGATHDLTSLIDAAELLLDCPDVFFVLIGGGTRVREVTASVAQRKLRNLALLPFQSSEHLPYWLAAADCAVVCLDEAFVGVSMPSKTYFAMAAGSALVAVSPPGTDLAAVVQATGCGIHVPPRNAKALADAIRRLCNDASYLEQCKVNSRRAAVREFDRARLVQRFADHLQEAFSGRRLPVGPRHARSAFVSVSDRSSTSCESFNMAQPQPSGAVPSFYRPTRGAIRLDKLRLDPEPLQADVRRIEQTTEWKPLKDGRHWSQIVLLKNEFRDPVLSSCPALERALAALPSRVLDACLKLLAPGGFVHEHRDITGASPMGVLRLHVPIVTDPGVEFYVNGTRVPLQPGEAWVLDTSYRHRVLNNSTVRRVHLVVDVELDRSLRALLPARDVWDRLHDVHFWLLCVLKGIVHVAKPRHLRSYLRLFVEQRIMHRSTLP